MSDVLRDHQNRLAVTSLLQQHIVGRPAITVGMLTTIWQQLLDRSPIGPDENFFDLGGDSLRAIQMCIDVEAATGRQLPITLLFEAPTIAQLATAIGAEELQGDSLARSPLVPIQPCGSKPPLFLCEGVAIYFPLVSYLGNDQPVYGLVTEAVADFASLEDLALHYLSVLMQTQPEGPYYLGGFSLGGVVALEMAQQLRAMGHRVGLLALIDTPGPGAYRLKTPARRALGHAKNLIHYGLPYLKAKKWKWFHSLSQKFLLRVHAEPKLDSRLIANVDQSRALFNYKARMYEIKPYTGQITLFIVARRNGMNSLFDPELGDVDPSLGWSSVAVGGLRKYELEGDHLSILAEPFVRPLGKQLRDCLDHGQS
jgi:thioesterase domain-containing protein/acyl carrier protein